jgi:hypothetical protein
MIDRIRPRSLAFLAVGGNRCALPDPVPGSLLGLPWSSALAFLLAALILISSGTQLARPEFSSKTQALYAQYYRSVYDGLSSRVELRGLLPWPDFFHGEMGWYRYGLSEVEAHTGLIRSLDNDEVPAILLAATIANQGGSAQRLFGIDVFERFQYWLGVRFDWPFPGWTWAAARWHDYVEEPSIGIAQLVPEEAHRLRGFGKPDLFDDATSIRLMYVKLANISAAADVLRLNQTQRFVLLAIANNDGYGSVRRLQDYDHDLERYLAEHPQTRIQVAKIMTFVDYLAEQGDWRLPDGVNREYIWWLVNRPMGAP